VTTPARQIRAEIDRLRLSIDHYEANLKRASSNKIRDVLRKERLAADEELVRLWKRLERSN
jgi:rubrerythrin